ncbi:KGGVGR-motif variant AAA ATPase [Candidatus Poribacteria bacterium]
METITFYSYKGGVGRTLALANVAIYLSRFGLNACLMDFDLEAPGLHHKFAQVLETSDIKIGLVDYIYEFTNDRIIPESLDEFSIEVIESSGSKGWVRLIPAGNVLSADYWRKLAAIDWRGLFYEDHSEGIPFFLELKEKISEEFNPDLLLIDSRTGITEMSGLCTALLADSVVFLIVNNQENIEGARQILRSIQNVERFPNQKPIDVTFALTRIPFPEADEDRETEGQIVERIRDSLNEHVEELENQLDVQDICVLHSDRELELSESLRLGQEEPVRETLLSRDYLRLFSEVVPKSLIEPNLDRILTEITANIGLLKPPDEAEQELESFVANYKHPKAVKMLIDFYIRHRSGVAKVVGAINDLWKTYRIDDPKILSTYISLFMEGKSYLPNIELEIIEEYLRSDPTDRVNIKVRLGWFYEVGRNYEMALKHYHQVIEAYNTKETILERILDIHIKAELYDRAIELFEEYAEAYTALNNMLQKALADEDKGRLFERLLELGKIFYRRNSRYEFNSVLIDSSMDSAIMRMVIDALEEKYGADDIPF